MTTKMSAKEICSIREWAPMTEIIDRIPARIVPGGGGLGLFPTDLNISCIDATEEFLALGSDVGIVFWYNRRTGEMQKLRPEVPARITCVKIVNSVEYMVAAGTSGGQVSVFQIQKELPPDLNFDAPCTRPKPIERYTIRDLHGYVTCCEWSKNGMKLYSGDRHGVLVLTEFDYQLHLSKSYEILRESFEIVQLSVYQSYLLVCTLYRSVLCQRSTETGQWHITQIGKKDRKELLDCGGVFLLQNQHRTDRTAQIICGRPGLRFWLADLKGNVEKTLLFKKIIASSPMWEIPILNPKLIAGRYAPPARATQTHTGGDQLESPDEDNSDNANGRNFGRIYVYNTTNERPQQQSQLQQDSLVLTHDGLNLYILNLQQLRVEAVARGFRKILDFCVCNKEIFILEGERSFLRLAPTPERPNNTAKVIFNPLMPPPVPFLGSIVSGNLETPVEYGSAEGLAVKAEECFELPPIEDISLDIPIELAVESPRAGQNRRLEIFNQIGQMEFEPSILHHSGFYCGNNKKKRNKNDKNINKTQVEGVVEIGHQAVVSERCKQETKEKPKTLGLKNKDSSVDVSLCQDPGPSGLSEIFNDTNQSPDFLTLNSLRKTIKEKTESLVENTRPLRDLNSETKQRITTSTPFSEATTPGKSDAGIQTTPRKHLSQGDLEAINDYSSGEPIDNLCLAFK